MEAQNNQKFTSLLETHKAHTEKNNQLIKEYNQKIQQAQRNVAQGIFGRTLAGNKVSEIKSAMSQIASNFQADSSLIEELVQRQQQNSKGHTLADAEAEMSKFE